MEGFRVGRVLNALMLIVVCCNIRYVDAAVAYNDVKSDHEALITAYQYSSTDSTSQANVIPRNDTTVPITVKIGMFLYALMDFDAVNGNIQIVGSLLMEWQDQIKTITSTTFTASLQTIFVSHDQIWAPNLVLLNDAESIRAVGDMAYKVRYNLSSGYCQWKPRMIINAACTPDMQYYPFDKQICNLTLTPWFQSVNDVVFESLTNEWNTDDLDPSGIWNIDSSTSTLTTKNNQSYVDFTLTIKRKPLFLVLVLVLPVLLLSLLTGFLFLLPAGSGVRVGFGMMCFLSFVVLLQTLMQFLPESSTPMSLLCYYIITMLMFSALLSIVNVFLLRMYLNPDKGDVPGSMIVFLELITGKVFRRCWISCRKTFRDPADGYAYEPPKTRREKLVAILIEVVTCRVFRRCRGVYSRCKNCSMLAFRSPPMRDKVLNTRFSGNIPNYFTDSSVGTYSPKTSTVPDMGMRLRMRNPSLTSSYIHSDIGEEAEGVDLKWRPSSVTKSRLNLTTGLSNNSRRRTLDTEYEDIPEDGMMLRRRNSTDISSSTRTDASYRSDAESQILIRKRKLEIEHEEIPDDGLLLTVRHSTETSTSILGNTSRGGETTHNDDIDEIATKGRQSGLTKSPTESTIATSTMSRKGPILMEREWSVVSSFDSDITWEYIAQLLDYFFLLTFVGVQTVFTIIFLVPLGSQYKN